MADIRCPMCGHQNPEGAVNCENCDARLVPMGSIGQDSTLPPEDSELLDQDALSSLFDDDNNDSGRIDDDLDAEILSWLDDDQPEKQDDTIDANGLFGESRTEPVEDPLSNLLDDIQEPVDEDTLVDWLDVTSETEDEESDEEVPDWMDVVNEDLSDEQEQEDDFLASILGEDESESDEELFQDLEAPFAEIPEEDLAMPDWLEDSKEEESADESVFTDGFEDDENIFSAPLSQDTVEESTPQLPDWLSGVSTESDEELNAEIADDSDLPDWFTQELSLGEDDTVAAEEPVFEVPQSPFVSESMEQTEEFEEEQESEAPKAGDSSILQRFSGLLEEESVTEEEVEKSSSDLMDFITSDDEVDDIFAGFEMDKEEDSSLFESVEESQEPVLFEEEQGISFEISSDAEELSEDGENSWDAFLSSDEFSPDEETLPDWFSKTGEEHDVSELTETSKSEENALFEDSTVFEEESPEEDTESGIAQDDWDLSSLLTDSHPLKSSDDDLENLDDFDQDLFEAGDDNELIGEPQPTESSAAFIEKSDDIFEQSESQVEENIFEEEPTQSIESPSADLYDDFLGDDLPDWLGEDNDEDEIESSERKSEGVIPSYQLPPGIPAWMDDNVGVDQNAPADESEEKTVIQEDDVSLPDWMTDMASTHGRTDELLDNVIEEPSSNIMDEELPVSPADDLDFEEGLPDWLSDEIPEDDSSSENEQDELADIFAVDDLEPEAETESESPEAFEDFDADLFESDEFDAVKETDNEPDVKGTAGLPEWLSDYESPDDDDLIVSEEVDIPDELDAWFAEQDNVDDSILDLLDGKEEKEELEPAIRTDTGELNSWIEDFGIQESEDEPVGDVEQEDLVPIDVEKSLPDWVLDLEPEEVESEDEESAGQPEWLDESAIDIVDDEELPPMEEGLFDFMEQGIEEESEQSEPSPEPELSSFESSDFDLSDWDEEIDVESIEAIEAVEENYASDMDLGDRAQTAWLEEYSDDEESEQVSSEESLTVNPFSISPEEVQDSEDISYVEELPEWVDEVDIDEDWGDSLETLAPISASIQTDFDQEQPDITHEKRSIELMERILLSEKGTVPTPSSRHRTRELTLRLVLSMLLVLAVLGGLFAVYPPQPDIVGNSPKSVALFQQQIQYHQQNSIDKPVLLVFDYQPAYQGEISVYAELPLKALMESNARIFTFSTTPEGPALAQNLLDEIRSTNNLAYNTTGQAVSLGYLPGGSTAVRDFSINMRSTVHGLDVGTFGTYVWDLPTVSDVDSIDDFAMVIVLTDDLDKARLWVEQATLYLPESVPMMMVASARISPMLDPYLLSEQLDGLIGSPVDAAAYGTLTNQSGNYLYYWRAYQLGIFLMFFTIAAGAVLQVVKQIMKTTHKRGGA